MRKKVMNSIIVIFWGMFLVCSLYTNVIKYWYMPTVTTAHTYDGAVQIEKPNGKVCPKVYPNVIPHECVMTKGGKSYVYVVESQIKTLGFRTVVRKVQVLTLATDWVQSAVTFINYKVTNSSIFVVERATGRLRDQMEVRLA